MFIPGQLKRMAQQESLVGIYLPFWTYDAHTSSQYRGERGETLLRHRKKTAMGKTKRVRKNPLGFRHPGGSHQFF